MRVDKAGHIWVTIKIRLVKDFALTRAVPQVFQV
jgi:hypothetical protein